MAVKIDIEVDEKTLKELVIKYLKEQLGDLGDNIEVEHLAFEVITSKNYRDAQWEQGRFRVKTLRVL